MRVTQNIINRTLTYGIREVYDRLGKLNEQLSTGKRVNTISDDVPAARQIMDLNAENNTRDVHMSNLESVDNMLSMCNSSLMKMSETISSIKELAIQASTGTYTDANRQSMAEGINTLLDSLVALGNVEYNGAYIFSGEATSTQPFQVTAGADGRVQSVQYVGAMVSTEVMVGPQTTAEANLVGRDVCQDDGDVFATTIALRDAVGAGDLDEINRLLGDLDAAYTGVRKSLGRLGERQNQMEMLQSLSETFYALNKQFISDQEDADIAELATQFNSQIALLQTALQVAARSMQPSLANYL